MPSSVRVQNTLASDESPSGGRRVEPRRARLLNAIDHAAHLLPAQGPITVFIHHNTLHAFEDLQFDSAVIKAASVFGCEPYLSLTQYREKLLSGRIRVADLRSVLLEDLKAEGVKEILPHGTRMELRLAVLQYPMRFGPREELLWFVAETDALRNIRSDVSAETHLRLTSETRRWILRDLRAFADSGNSRSTANESDNVVRRLLESFSNTAMEHWSNSAWEAFTLQALWKICLVGVAHVEPRQTAAAKLRRHREVILKATGFDCDLLVHEVLIRFCAAFLDQGLAQWPLPNRDAGMFNAFCSLYSSGGSPPDRWLRKLPEELRRWQDNRAAPLDTIVESLDLLGVKESEWDQYISECLLALRGWAGITRFLEERPDRSIRTIPPGSLIDLLAIRLMLDRLALEHAVNEHLSPTRSIAQVMDQLSHRDVAPSDQHVEQRAFEIFQLAQVLGWTPEEMHRLEPEHWIALVHELESFPTIDQRRIFHQAYERRFYNRTLDALAIHSRDSRPESQAPRFQAMFCIDEREESMRRHIEEMAPDAVTYGIAGFYFVAMYYKGVQDAHFVPLCPAVMKPQHWVVETTSEQLSERSVHRDKTRRALGKATHGIHVGSRTFVVGAVISGAVGVLATIPLIARTLFPRLTAQTRRTMSRFIFARPKSRLQLERLESKPRPEIGDIGFSLDEMTAIAERVLRDTGLTSNFARLVLTFGHGSTSMNNPHESAHDCGACGGARGGPNGRAIAQILNDHRVRAKLQSRGITIPDDTVFVGGMHNTSSEAVTFDDLDRIPDTHRTEFSEVRLIIEKAADRDAHERCRRFESAPLTLSFEAARQHVEGRAEDLSQVRPEWGHATNAVTIVGRRQLTRGLFLDRRAFLNSYDPTQDDAQATILTRILQACVPVCAGISLEYYFSFVDNAGYGSGTKLPHNITSLLGVMDGAASDLRTGLPWQMVEIHEPVRQLFVIETTPSAMIQIMDKNPGIARLVRNEWVRLAVIDPQTRTIHIFRDESFEAYTPETPQLPNAASSVDWYRGWRDHLEFAQIVPNAALNGTR